MRAGRGRLALAGDGRRAGLHGPPHPQRRQRHVDVLDPEVAHRVEHGVDHRRGRGDGARLADALGPQRVRRRGGGRPVGREVRQVGRPGDEVVDERRRRQRPLVVVDRLLVEGLRDALGEATVHLALDDQRVDDLADVVDADVVADGDPTGLGVDLGRAQVGAVREGEVLGVERRLGVQRGLDPVGQVVGGEHREREVRDPHALVGAPDGEPAALELQVVGVGLEHVRRDHPGLLDDLLGRLDHRDAAPPPRA